ncbi:25S rRNA [Penicillium rolfsii]|nr:25S rRNA [Penicillium rolfsii]
MFAVPGWSLESSALKQQTQPAQAKNESKPTDDSATPNGKNKDKKRKRENVTSGNVNEMYRKHIEGQSEKPWNKKKQEKQASAAIAAAAAAASTATPKADKEEVNTGAADSVQEEGQGKKKRQRKNKNKQSNDTEDKANGAAPAQQAASAASSLIAPPPTNATLTPLQQAMRQKLISSRFRHLNETLYTTDSSKAVELFNANPELFDEYHAGFSRQVKESWPSNPVDGYIQAVRRRGAVPVPKRGKPDPNKPLPLPRRPNGVCNIADLGCGDAALARNLTPSAKKLNLKLNSYDLQAPDPLITKADISKLPVEDGSMDVSIFCLSLMGTNWVSFVEEAWRVLRSDGKGECWVSEVKSRFGKVTRKKSMIGAQKPLSKTQQKKQKKSKKDEEDEIDEADIFAEDARPSADDDETDISAFVEVFRTRGFVLRPESVDKSNKMFVKMEFVKQGGAPIKGKHATGLSAPAPGGKKRFVDRKPASDNGMTAEQEAQVLKPCVYKIR